MSLTRGLITLTLLVLFVRLTIWAWSARRKPVFDSMARLPLQDDDEECPPTLRGRP
jgi:cytochrome c oxidase cbb3-type subunit IV